MRCETGRLIAEQCCFNRNGAHRAATGHTNQSEADMISWLRQHLGRVVCAPQDARQATGDPT